MSTYKPPSKRVAKPGAKPELPETLDFSDQNFPSLGQVQLATTKRENLSEKIKEQIRLEDLLNKEKLKEREIDHRKMTHEELLADGWAILPLKGLEQFKIDRSS
jgi:hypothetical protein